MKKSILLITFIIYSITCIGQQLALNSVVSIDLPNGIEKITKQQALEHAGKKFNNNKLILHAISDRNTKHIFKIDDVLISLTVFDETIKIKEGLLLQNKKGLDAMNGGNPTYSSVIRKINNNSVLILNFTENGTESYNFHCYNANNTHEMTGVLEFNPSDKEKATSILNHILNSIKFKE